MSVLHSPFFISSFVDFSPSSLMSTKIKSVPALAKSLAVSFPMPDEQPVIKAVFPFREISFSSSLGIIFGFYINWLKR